MYWCNNKLAQCSSHYAVLFQSIHSQFVLLQGTLTEDDTLASHHVCASPHSAEEGQGQFVYIRVIANFIISSTNLAYNMIYFSDEWMRPVMRKDTDVLVHWGMHPDR